MPRSVRPIGVMLPKHANRCPKKRLKKAFKIVAIIALIAVYMSWKSEKEGSAVAPSGSSPPGAPKLVILFVRGLRWDYINDPGLQGFESIVKNGAKAQSVLPVFPSNHYPNWMSAMTGMYPEDHGFMDDNMYNVETNDYFLIGQPNRSSAHRHWWKHSVPLWVRAEKSGIKTALYFVDDCNLKIDEISPTVCVQDRPFWPEDNRLTQLTQAFSGAFAKIKTEEIGLAILHYTTVETFGKLYGPDSPERIGALKNLDNFITEAWQKLRSLPKEYNVNFVIMSDHGMASNIAKDKKRHSIDLHESLKSIHIELMVNSGTSAMMQCSAEEVPSVYQTLISAQIEGLKIYERDTPPKNFRFKRREIVLPILLFADQGYFIQFFRDVTNLYPSAKLHLPAGVHGFDPEQVPDMKTVFIAAGSMVKPGSTSNQLKMVDVYLALCHFLGLPPKQGKGNWSNVSPVMI